MLSHFFPSLFNNATQQITSNHGFLNIKTVILHDLFFLSIFFFGNTVILHTLDAFVCKIRDYTYL